MSYTFELRKKSRLDQGLDQVGQYKLLKLIIYNLSSFTMLQYYNGKTMLCSCSSQLTSCLDVERRAFFICVFTFINSNLNLIEQWLVFHWSFILLDLDVGLVTFLWSFTTTSVPVGNILTIFFTKIKFNFSDWLRIINFDDSTKCWS